MKKILLFALVFCSIINLSAQKQDGEKYGNTLNIGAGLGYGYFVPGAGVGIMANYEIDIPPVKNLTLAPFVGFYSYHNTYYSYNPGHGYYMYNDYWYTSVPFGVKGSYYFDELFRASDKWDFYGAVSMGLTFNSIRWQNGYYGDVYPGYHPLYVYAALHAGAEYHFSEKVGMFLDLSTANSTFGLGFHF